MGRDYETVIQLELLLQFDILGSLINWWPKVAGIIHQSQNLMHMCATTLQHTYYYILAGLFRRNNIFTG